MPRTSGYVEHAPRALWLRELDQARQAIAPGVHGVGRVRLRVRAELLLDEIVWAGHAKTPSA
jgi:hypothetical protein